MDFIQPKPSPPQRVTSSSPIPQTQSKPITASPFFMFLADQQKIVKEQNSNTKLLDIAADAIKEWDQATSLQDEYTAKFIEESEKIEAAIILNPQPSSPAQPEIKFGFDLRGNPLPPKRPLSAFFLFHKDHIDRVRRENPSLRITEVSRLIGEMWRDVDQQTRLFYEAKGQEAKALYQQEVALFEAKYGKMETYREAKKAGRTKLGGLFQISSHSNLG